tara:strand:+ start:1658 stop:1999 length:342 start_codon:yes stop_codon:yes gene_type:complete
MGFFSWKTSDTDESIPNRHSGRKPLPVKLLDNKGNEYRAEEYDGYGTFAGIDYYALLDTMNGGTGDRDRGIDLEYNSDTEVFRPKLVTLGCTTNWADLPDSPDCPDQGFFYNF